VDLLALDGSRRCEFPVDTDVPSMEAGLLFIEATWAIVEYLARRRISSTLIEVQFLVVRCLILEQDLQSIQLALEALRTVSVKICLLQSRGYVRYYRQASYQRE